MFEALCNQIKSISLLEDRYKGLRIHLASALGEQELQAKTIVDQIVNLGISDQMICHLNGSVHRFEKKCLELLVSVTSVAPGSSVATVASSKGS